MLTFLEQSHRVSDDTRTRAPGTALLHRLHSPLHHSLCKPFFSFNAYCVGVLCKCPKFFFLQISINRRRWSTPIDDFGKKTSTFSCAKWWCGEALQQRKNRGAERVAGRIWRFEKKGYTRGLGSPSIPQHHKKINTILRKIRLESAKKKPPWHNIEHRWASHTCYCLRGLCAGHTMHLKEVLK